MVWDDFTDEVREILLWLTGGGSDTVEDDIETAIGDVVGLIQRHTLRPDVGEAEWCRTHRRPLVVDGPSHCPAAPIKATPTCDTEPIYLFTPSDGTMWARTEGTTYQETS
jgi:hypothetical protein